MKNLISHLTLTPAQGLAFERFMFACADKLIGGYNGGVWRTQSIDGVIILTIPGEADTVTLHNADNYCEVSTDRLTASIAFTFLMMNWFWHNHNHHLSDKVQEKFHNHHYAMRNVAYGDASKVNAADFHAFTD